MEKSTNLPACRCFIFLVVSFLFFQLGAFGQWQYLASKVQNLTGTYADLGTSGTVISTANFDNANSAAQNIGFTFFYNGATFTQFVLNTNGFIKLGITAPAMTNNFDVLSSAEANTLAPFNFNLIGGTSPEYRVATSGSAGSRTCTIQFKNVKDAGTAQYNNINFQIKLYETSNMIEFVYGTFTASGNPANFKEMIVGIKGSDSTFSVNCQKSSADGWETTEFINGVYPNHARKFNNRNDALPPLGQTFRFIPVNDAKVDAIYALGKVPKPWGAYQEVTAKVKNLGATTLENYHVTLNITGANTLTAVDSLSTLAPNDSANVSWKISLWNSGNNTLTASVPSDDNNSNNSVSYLQVVNDSSFSYADTAAAIGRAGFNTSEGTMLAKYRATGGDLQITAIRVYISNDPNNVGQTVYGIVGATTNAIATNPAVLQASDLGKYKTFPLVSPIYVQYRGYFYVGLKQLVNVLGFRPVGYQKESPVRGFTYFQMDASGNLSDFTAGRLMIEAVVIAAPPPANTNETLIEWDFEGVNSTATAAASYYHPLLASSNLLTRGPTATPSPGTNTFLTKGFKNDGISTSNTDYFQFKLTPGTGDTMALSFLIYHTDGDPDFAPYPHAVSQWAYSLNGINFSLIGSPATYVDDVVRLDTISVLKKILPGTTVTFRYYASGVNDTSAWGLNNLYILGSIWHHRIKVNQVVPTGADYTLASCGSTASGSIGFTSTGVFPPGNIYVAKMNNSIWYHDTIPIVVGTLTSSANSGTINITIPTNSSTAYSHDIWVESSMVPDALLISSPPFYINRITYCQTPSDYFRSKKDGNWNDPTTWEISPNGADWYASTLYPTREAHRIYIQPDDTVTLTIPVGVHYINVYGFLKVLNGGANTGSITFYNSYENFIGRNLRTTMYIYQNATLQIVSSAVFDSVIRRATTHSMINNFGRIMIGDGSSVNGDGFYKFATIHDGTFSLLNASVFEWNTTSTNSLLAKAEYFSPIFGHPILRISKIAPGGFGGSDSTVINGILEINTPVIMSGSGKKILQDGIVGSSTLTQGSAGEMVTLSTFHLEGPPPGGEGPIVELGIMNGALTINLGSQGLRLANGIAFKSGSNVTITGSGTSDGPIQVELGGRMTLDPGAVLTINNADLSNEGIIDGTGKLQFTGTDTSIIRSSGIINSKIELSAKQIRLDGDAITSSIDLLNGSHLRLDSFDLHMRTGNLVGDSLNYIVTNDTGRVMRFVGSTEVPFLVGVDESSYNPVSITNTGTPDNFSVRVGAGIFKDSVITHNFVDRTWFISDSIEGGSHVKVKMQWRAADEQPGFDRSNSYISRISVCPLPRNCSGSYFDPDAGGTAIDIGEHNYTRERSGIDSFKTNAFVVTSRPFVYTFNGSGTNWSDTLNWTPGIIPSHIIGPGMEVIINPAGATECISNGNIQVIPPGRLTIMPGKKIKITNP